MDAMLRRVLAQRELDQEWRVVSSMGADLPTGKGEFLKPKKKKTKVKKKTKGTKSNRKKSAKRAKPRAQKLKATHKKKRIRK